MTKMTIPARVIPLLLAFVLPITASHAQDSTEGLSVPDLELTYSDTSLGTAIIGGRWNMLFTVKSVGDNVPIVFPQSSFFLLVDLPSDFTFEDIDVGWSEADGAFDINCSIANDTLTCTTGSELTLLNLNSVIEVEINSVEPAATGSFTVPAGAGMCLVDPDNVISEQSLDNNSCGPRTIDVREAPEFTAIDWMGVTMWDNIVRIYDQASDQQTNAVSMDTIDEVDVFAINDIVRHPSNGMYYVFHRFYQSTTHNLGTFDPAAGITTIGDTGTSFHDSAFSPEGILYAVGRDSALYSIDLNTGAATALCDTPFGTENYVHSALTWDTDSDDLLQLADNGIHAIDLENLPVNAEDPCPSVTSPVDNAVNESVFAAVYEQNQIVALDDSGDLWLIADDGAAALLGEPPKVLNGMVPNPGTLPERSAPCLADGYLHTESYSRTGELFALQTGDKAITFLTVLDEDLELLDFNPNNQRLVGLYTEGKNSQTLVQLDPCTGQLISSNPVSGDNDGSRLRSIDIVPDGATYAGQFSGPLYELDPETGVTTSLGGTDRRISELAVKDDRVIIGRIESGDGTALDIYEFTNWDNFIETVPVTYGPDLAVGSERELSNLEADRDNSDYTGLLTRAPVSQGSNTDEALPTVLIRIDSTGQAQKIMSLPATTTHITLRNEESFKDGYEEADQ